jgi:hypothetical protein
MRVVDPERFFRLVALDQDVGGAGVAAIMQDHTEAVRRDLARERHHFVMRAPSADQQCEKGTAVSDDLIGDVDAADFCDRHG